MIPAHALFDKAANNRFKLDHQIAGRIRHFIENDENDPSFAVENPYLVNCTKSKPEPKDAECQSAKEKTLYSLKWHPAQPLSPGRPLLVGYRYTYRSDVSEQIGEYRKFANDAVFLPFEPGNKKEAEDLQRELYSFNLYRQDQLHETDYQALIGYYKKPTKTAIAVKGFRGYLNPGFDISEYEPRNKALMLEFVLKSKPKR